MHDADLTQIAIDFGYTVNPSKRDGFNSYERGVHHIWFTGEFWQYGRMTPTGRYIAHRVFKELLNALVMYATKGERNRYNSPYVRLTKDIFNVCAKIGIDKKTAKPIYETIKSFEARRDAFSYINSLPVIDKKGYSYAMVKTRVKKEVLSESNNC
jgi:hypothetical protein